MKYNYSILHNSVYQYLKEELKYLIQENHAREYFESLMFQKGSRWIAMHRSISVNHTPTYLYEYCQKLINMLYYIDEFTNNEVDEIYRIIYEFEQFYNEDSKIVGNWWEWRIGIPRLYLFILFLHPRVGDSHETAEKTLNKFVRKFAKNGDLTYANQASICKNLFIMGVIFEKDKYIDEALKYSIPAFMPTNPVKVKIAQWMWDIFKKHKWDAPVWLFRWKEGLYTKDGSFIQHTAIPYIGTYGVEILEFANFLTKCGIDIPTKITKYLPDWITAFKYSIYDGQMMLMYCGRSINDVDPYEIASKVNSYIKNIETYLKKEIKIPEEFTLIQENSAKVIHQQKGYRFCISLCSDRVAQYEAFNGSNYDGCNENLGATYLYLPGDDNYSYNYLTRVGYKTIPGTLCAFYSSYFSVQPFTKMEQINPKFTYDGIDTVKFEYDSDFGRIYRSWTLYSDMIICSGESKNVMPSCIVDERKNSELVNIDSGVVYDKKNKIGYFGDVLVIGKHQIITHKNTSFNFKYVIVPNIEEKDCLSISKTLVDLDGQK